MPQPLRYGGYWDDGWDDSLRPGTWNSGPLAWYWLQTRAYDPRLKRFLQPDAHTQAGLPDYVYAADDPLDVSDPSGQDGSAAQCGQQSYANDPVQHARCNVAFLTYQQNESNNQTATGLAATVAVGALSFAGGDVFVAGLQTDVLGSALAGNAGRTALSGAIHAGFNVDTTIAYTCDPSATGRSL